MNPIAAALALLGRWGTQAFAASVIVGLAVPPLASLARPLLPWTVVTFLTIMFARVNLEALGKLVRHPGRAILACIWLVLAPPVLAVAIMAALGRLHPDEGLLLGIAIQAAAPPLSSTPGIAMLLGIEPALILLAVLVTTAAASLTSPLVVEFVAGAAVPLDSASFIQRLGLLIGISLALAAIVRLALGRARLERLAGTLDGVGVLAYLVFGIAAMDGVLAATWRDPARSATYLGTCLLLSGLGFIASWLLLRPLAPRDRLVVGYATGQRNMSVLVGALGAHTPEAAFLYFALGQLPIFLLPQLIRPLARRTLRPARSEAPPGA